MSEWTKKEGYFSKIQKDSRANIYAIGLYLALLKVWEMNNYANPFHTTRREIMQYSHSGSIVTYHKYIRELVRLGYIAYTPSYHPAIGSRILLK